MPKYFPFKVAGYADLGIYVSAEANEKVGILSSAL